MQTKNNTFLCNALLILKIKYINVGSITILDIYEYNTYIKLLEDIFFLHDFFV